MKSNIKRFLAMVMAVVMVVGMMPLNVFAADGDDDTQAATSSLVAFYDFSENDTGTVYDASGNGNDAELINGAAVSADPRGVGYVLNLQNNSSASGAKGLKLPAAMFKGIEDVTIVMDVYLNSTSTWMCLLNAGVSGQQLKYMTFVNEGNDDNTKNEAGETIGACGISNATSAGNGSEDEEKRVYAAPETKLQPGAWGRVALRHVASTGEAQIYLNNQLVASGTLDATLQDLVADDGCEVRIGSNNIWNDPGLNGLVDNIRVYNKALSEAELAAIPNVTIDTEAELIAAVAAGGTVTLGGDIVLTQKVTVSVDTTITGAYTITRGDAYTGNLFTVNAGATLTFNGVTLDGGNNYTFNQELYDTYVAQNVNIFDETNGSFVTSEEGAPVATAYTIQNNGTLDFVNTTVQNFYGNNGAGVVNVGTNSVTKFTSLNAKHIAMEGSGALIRINGEGSKLYIEAGTVIDDVYGEGNGGAMQAYAPNTDTVVRSEVVMNGGTIKDCKTVGGNASVIMLRNANMTMNAGTITECSSARGTGNNRGGVIYLNWRANFIMNGGEIKNNASIVRAAVDVRDDTNYVELNGGKISGNWNNPTTVGTEGYCGYGEDTVIGSDMVIDNGVRVMSGTLTNNGTIGSVVAAVDGVTLAGSGTATGEVTVFANCNATITSGTYLGDLTIEEGATLTITGGTFANLEAIKYLADGLGMAKNEDGTYTVTDQVAEVGGVVYNSVDDAEAAVAAEGGTIKMLAIAPVKASVAVDQPTVIDLNGNELYATVADVYPVIRALSDVTVQGGGVDAMTFGSGYAFIVGSNDVAGTLTVKDGKHYGSTTVASVTKGTLNIEGGYYEATPYITYNEDGTVATDYGYRYTLNCIDANYNAGTAVVNVTGGTFYGFDPDNNLAEGEDTDFVGEKYASTETAATEEGRESTWTVSKIYNYVAKIEETGEQYETLAEAVAAANELGTAATVTLLKDVTLGEKLTVSGNVTIQGAHTITRDDAYTGTLFTVPTGATLTLDGGLVIDGGNNYAFDTEAYEADLANFTNIATADSAKWFTPEEGAPVATAFMITNSGTVNLNKVTIQNNYSANSGVVLANAGSTVTLDGATVTHVASTNSNGVVVQASGAGINITMEEGTVIDGNHVGGNHGLFKVYSGAVFTMNGGEITNTTGWNSNGIAVGVYWGTFNMNGGTICNSTSANGPSNGRCGAVYLHSGHTFKMTGGTICHNRGGSRGGLDAPYSNGTATITGGKIVHNSSYYAERGYAESYPPDVNGTVSMTITGGTYTQDVAQWVPEGYGVAIDVVEENGEEVIYYTVTDQIIRLERTGEIYCSIREAMKVAEDGDTLTVLCSHRIDNESVILDKDVTIDLGGKTIYGWGTIDPVFRVVADVTVTGEGKLDTRKFADAYGFILGASDGSVSGNLTIAGGTYLSDVTVASVTKGNLNVTGGQFAVTAWKQVVGTDENGNDITEDNYNFVLNCIDSNYKDGSANITVTGGTFYMYDPENNAAEGAGTNFVPNTHYSNEDTENYWTVYAKPVVTVTFDNQTMVLGNEMPEFTYTTNFTEVAEDGTMLVVGEPEVTVNGVGEYEITAEAYVFMNDTYLVNVVPGKLTVQDAVAEANGIYYASIESAISQGAASGEEITVTVLKDHTVATNANYGLIYARGRHVTLDLNGKVVTFDYTAKTDAQTVYASIYVSNGSNMVIKDSVGGGKLYNKGLSETATNGARIVWIASGSSLTIENGIFETDQKDTMFYTSNSNKEVPTGLYIKDGLFIQHELFAGSNNGNLDCFNQQNGYQKQIIELTGGTYNNDPRTGFENDWEVTIPEGYTVIDNGNGTWSILPCIKVTFDDQEMYLGEEVPELTYTVDYGYIGEEVVNVNVEVTPIDKPAEKGEYTITGTATLTDGTGDADNYAVIVVDGTLTVSRKLAVVEVEMIPGVWGSTVITDDNWADLVAALGPNTSLPVKVTMYEDVELTEGLVIDGGEVVLDLNGKTITCGEDVYPAIRIQGDADVTVKNGTIKNDDYVFVLGASDGSSSGNLTIESGSYYGNTSVASVTKGELTITGGYFEATEYDGAHEFTLNCIDANYKAGTAKIVVTGGEFYGFDPEDNAAEGEGTNFCAKHYVSVQNAATEEGRKDTWTVMPATEASYVCWNMDTGVYYKTVSAGLEEAVSGQTVQLLTDCKDGYVLVTPGTTLDLNGYTLTADYVVGFNTSAICDSTNNAENGYVAKGLLVVEPNNIVLYEGNGAVPVYNSDRGGYIFVDFLFQAKATVSGDVARVEMVVTTRTMEVIDLLKDGANDNDIQIVVRLTWDSETGTAYQDFVFNEQTVQNVMQSNGGTFGKFGRMFFVDVSGMEELTGVTATPMVIAGSNAVDSTSTLEVN